MAEIWKYMRLRSRVERYLKDFRNVHALLSAIDNSFTIDTAEIFHKYTDVDHVLLF